MVKTQINAPADSVEWRVEVIQPMPDVTDLQEAISMCASPNKMKERRSSKFMKVTITPSGDAKEPFKQGDEYYCSLGPIKIASHVLESSSSEEGPCVVDTSARGLCGLLKVRLRFTIYKNEAGVLCGKAQEAHLGMKFLFPAPATVELEHRTMFEEHNEVFKNKK
jgi:hypothetical protein